MVNMLKSQFVGIGDRSYWIMLGCPSRICLVVVCPECIFTFAYFSYLSICTTRLARDPLFLAGLLSKKCKGSSETKSPRSLEMHSMSSSSSNVMIELHISRISPNRRNRRTEAEGRQEIFAILIDGLKEFGSRKRRGTMFVDVVAATQIGNITVSSADRGDLDLKTARESDGKRRTLDDVAWALDGA